MKVLLMLCALSATCYVRGALTAPSSRRAQNFLVHDLRVPASVATTFKAPEERGWVSLDLDGLALTAERVKHALCRALDLPARGWGRIHLFLTVAPETERDITVVATRFADGWQYRVDIPDRLEDLKLVRALVGTLLLELANRGAGSKSAEIPTWLNEGLSLHLKNAVGPELILRSVPDGSMLRSVRDVRGADALREARAVLRSVPAMTISELGRPDPEQLTGENLTRYQNSAQLFVEELCRLPNGRACLMRMLRELPSYWNWETAFLHSFQTHFSQMLDVEKWWTVTLLGFTGRDFANAWPPEACFEKLEEILLLPAQVRTSPDVLPVRIYVTPQQLVAEWDYPQQKAALERMVKQLAALRMNCPGEVVTLVDRYRGTFQTYLQKRSEANSMTTTGRQMTLSVQLLVRDTIERLDDLYRRREALRRDYLALASSSAKPK